MVEYEKVIKIHEKSFIPRDIIESDKSLQSYLAENVKENQKHERIRLRVAKAQRTRINHSLDKKARQIIIEPSTDSEPLKQQQRKSWKCKPVTEEPREGSLVVQEIKGIWVLCERCGYKWIHHSNNLGKQYYCQCPRCRRNIRLKHYQ